MPAVERHSLSLPGATSRRIPSLPFFWAPCKFFLNLDLDEGLGAMVWWWSGWWSETSIDAPNARFFSRNPPIPTVGGISQTIECEI